MIVAEAMAATLAKMGVRFAFGMVGSTVAPLAQGLATQPGVRVVPTRHEQAGGHMADAVARMTGRPTVSYGHAAPGGLNLVMAAATAFRDSSPVIFINGDVEREQFGHEAWQAVDTMVQVFTPITKAALRLEDPARAVEWTRRMVLVAVSGRPGPVYLQVPRDVLKAEYTGTDLPVVESLVPVQRPAAEARVVEQMAEKLRQASRPVLVVGGGVTWSGAEMALARVAERLGAPVITSQTSRGALDETGPLCVGASGHLGNPVASRALREADVVLAVGNRLSDLQWDYGKLWNGQTLLHVDLDATEIGRHYPATLSACADAKVFLEQLEAALPETSSRAGAWVSGLLQDRDAWYEEQLKGDGHFGPGDVMAAVWQELPADAVMTIGAGRHAQFSSKIPHHQPGTLVKAIGSAAMGHAFPAAMAVPLVHPDRAGVAMVGDGDFLMNIQDMETAVREKLPVICVVFNDFKLASQAGRGFQVGVTHGNPDFVTLAESFGALGLRATNREECRQAMREALSARRPTIIDARVQG